MASETLSQNEIDQLLGGAGARESQQPSSPVSAPDVQVYDFRRPHRVSKEKLRTLEAMYERFVKSFEGWLLGRVRGQIELKLMSVEQYSFGEFILSLRTPCASYIFDIHESGGQQGVVDFGHEFAYFLVDRLFGGGGEPTTMDRALTPIERMAIRIAAERVTSLISEVWQDHVELQLALSGFESIPEILRAANREDPVLVANIEVSAGSTSSLLLICLPFAVLEKFFSSSGQRRVNTVSGSKGEQQANREITESSVRATRLPVAARLPEFRLPMRDLVALRTGAIVYTAIPRDAEPSVLVSGQPRFRAAAGRVGRKLAMRIIEPVVVPPGQAGDLHTRIGTVTHMDTAVQTNVDGGAAPSGAEVLQPELAELGAGVLSAGEVPLSMLLDLTLPVSIELGRTSMTVQEVLRLGRGAVIQLERLAGEPIDIYVGDRRFAEGEVVVLGEHFGVRITRIVSHKPPSETAA